MHTNIYHNGFRERLLCLFYWYYGWVSIRAHIIIIWCFNAAEWCRLLCASTSFILE